MQWLLTHKPLGSRGSCPVLADKRRASSVGQLCAPSMPPRNKAAIPASLAAMGHDSFLANGVEAQVMQATSRSALSAEGCALHFPIFPLECGPAGEISWPDRQDNALEIVEQQEKRSPGPGMTSQERVTTPTLDGLTLVGGKEIKFYLA